MEYGKSLKPALIAEALRRSLYPTLSSARSATKGDLIAVLEESDREAREAEKAALVRAAFAVERARVERERATHVAPIAERIACLWCGASVGRRYPGGDPENGPATLDCRNDCAHNAANDGRHNAAIDARARENARYTHGRILATMERASVARLPGRWSRAKRKRVRATMRATH